MNDKDTSLIDFGSMQGVSNHAFEYMRKILNRYNNALNNNEEKLVNLYCQTCKIELVV